VITDDEIMRLFELADPTRDDDSTRMVDPAGYLDALRTRSYDMQLIDTPEAPTKSPRDNRWVLAAIAAAAIVLIAAGALILSRDNDDNVPAAPPTTVAPPEPTVPVDQADAMTADDAIAIVRSYFDARNAYDADLALSFLAEDALVPSWSQATAMPHTLQLPDEYRLEIENGRATGSQRVLGDCTTIEAEGGGITIRCGSETQDFRSDELGLGPFDGGGTDVVVADGKITSILDGTGPSPSSKSSASLSDNDFQRLLWDPFGAWMDAQHPDDRAVMFADDTPTAASIPLWDQRLSEWVALRLAAEREAADFLRAFAAFDPDAAGTYLAHGASTGDIISEDVQDYAQAIALYQAWGYEQQLGSCYQAGATATAMEVRCPFTYQLLGSGELGFDPFDGSNFTVTVDNQTGLITKVDSTWLSGEFARSVADPFTEWVTTTHPEAEAQITVNGQPALTPESLALWAQYRQEYVQYVLANTPTTTAA
jgi:hypothetical protein